MHALKKSLGVLLLWGTTLYSNPTGRVWIDDSGQRTEEYVAPGGKTRTITGPHGEVSECHTTPTGERCIERSPGLPASAKPTPPPPAPTPLAPPEPGTAPESPGSGQ
jgi:hypothetical protein